MRQVKIKKCFYWLTLYLYLLVVFNIFFYKIIIWKIKNIVLDLSDHSCSQQHLLSIMSKGKQWMDRYKFFKVHKDLQYCLLLIKLFMFDSFIVHVPA